MASPPPVKPPRAAKQTRETSGLLMSVIRTLSATETNEQRDREKAKLEKEYKKCDKRLDELVLTHDRHLTQVMQVFGGVCGIVTTCRARICAVRARLAGCKQLLRWRRADLHRLCGEAAQHRHALILLTQIEQLTGVRAEMSAYLLKNQYLNAAVVLNNATITARTDLCKVEALQNLRDDLENKRQNLYERILKQINIALYQVNIDDVTLKRQGSSRRPELPRLISTQSEDSMLDITPQFELDLADESRNLKINLSLLIESIVVIRNVKECTESIKVQMQTELLNVITRMSQYVLDFGSSQLPLAQTTPMGETFTAESEISKRCEQESQNAQPLVELLGILLNYWRVIAERHQVLLDLWKYALNKHNIQGINLYSMDHYWNGVQAVLQLLLTDYLDIQSLKSSGQRITYQEQPLNIDFNSYFVKKKPQTKKKVRLFKFSSSNVEVASPTADRIEGSAAAATYKLVCTPAPEHLTHVYHLLSDFMDEIEKQTKASNILRAYLDELIRGVQGERVSSQLLEQITKLSAEAAWREYIVIPLTPSKNKTLYKCGVQSWEACSYALAGWVRLGDLGARAARSALSPALAALATAARRRATYLAPRARSYAWRTDNDITRFLKALPNWIALKTPPSKEKKNSQREIEDMQRGFEREAEILGSSLGDSNVSEKEIITNINILKDIAIMCETMEWFSVKLKNWRIQPKSTSANDLKVNGMTASPAACKLKNPNSFDALLAELASSSAVFEEISDNCLLLLHLEVRMQCFHYLGKLGSSLGLTADPKPTVSSSHIVPESPATALARTLHSFSEHVAPVLNHRRLNYIMEGLGEMMSAVIVGNWRMGGSNSVASVSSQLEPLRHCLTAAQISSDGLHKAALYLQMLTMSPEEILKTVSEKGAVFSELEYMNAFQVIAKTTNQPDYILKANLNKLTNILGNIGVTV